jgi:broad-specificity NMP kinase
MAVLVTVWGASPGVGKSTLCAGLSQSLVEAGLAVDHFREEEILTRPQFAAVAEDYRATGLPGYRCSAAGDVGCSHLAVR